MSPASSRGRPGFYRVRAGRKLIDIAVQKHRERLGSFFALLSEFDETWKRFQMERHLPDNTRNTHLALVAENLVHVQRKSLIGCITDGANSCRRNARLGGESKNVKAFHFDSIRAFAQMLLFVRSPNRALGCVEPIHYRRATSGRE